MATRKILPELQPHLAAQIQAKNQSRPKNTSKAYIPKQQEFIVRQPRYTPCLGFLRPPA